MRLESRTFLPFELVFHPTWWHKQTGLRFDRDFFFEPDRRINDEMKMRRVLWEHFGGFGLGEEHPRPEPYAGPVHLAAGFMLSSLWGCGIRFHDDASPEVQPRRMSIEELAGLDSPDPGENREFRDFFRLVDVFSARFGYVLGDINWSGLQNLALDLVGQDLFLAYYDSPALVHRIYDMMNRSLFEILRIVREKTGTTSLSVNRSIANVDPSINLQSNCSVQMISNAAYEEFLLPHELELSRRLQPYGIHHCGNNMHELAEGYAKVREACFFDVGWGADVTACRAKIPDAFFNLRLSPVKIATCTPDEVERDVVGLLRQAGDLSNVGVCCINIDHATPDENVARILEVVERYRRYGA